MKHLVLKTTRSFCRGFLAYQLEVSFVRNFINISDLKTSFIRVLTKTPLVQPFKTGLSVSMTPLGDFSHTNTVPSFQWVVFVNLVVVRKTERNGNTVKMAR